MLRGIACLVAALAVGACGGSSEPAPADDREQIEETVSAYFAALVDGDVEKACGQVTEAVQRNIATARGQDSCERALEGVDRAIESDPAGEERMRAMRVADVEIDGATASVRVAFGESDAPAPIPMEKTGDGWRIAGLINDVDYRSQAEAECVQGGMQSFAVGEADPFWKREGREDFRDYIVQTCRRAYDQGVLDEPGNEAELQRIAGRVLLRMVRSGQVRDPR